MRSIRFASITMILLLVSVSVRAQEKGFGVGALFGEPTGISAKLWVSEPNAIDAGIAYSFSGKGFFHLHADLLWHFPGVVPSKEQLPLYAGIGARIRFADPARVGVRFPIGVAWWMKRAPIDLFLELVPILDLSPGTKLGFNGGVGARYYFE